MERTHGVRATPRPFAAASASPRAWLACLLVLLAVLTVACGDKRKLEADGDFSVNVMQVPDWWPREDRDWPEDAAEREAQQREKAARGTPDFFRFVHTYDGRIVRLEEMHEGAIMAGRRPSPLLEWIYVQDELVVSFKGGEAKERPLDDMLKTVCLYGDPNEIKNWTDHGDNRISYTYYSHGKTFTFVDGKLDGKPYDFTPMPAWRAQ